MSTDRFLINAYMAHQMEHLAQQMKQINSMLAEAFEVLPPGTVDPVAGVRTLVRDKQILDYLEEHGLPRSLRKCGGLNERTQGVSLGSAAWAKETLMGALEHAHMRVREAIATGTRLEQDEEAAKDAQDGEGGSVDIMDALPAALKAVR